MKSAFRSKHADRVVLVRSDDSGLATGRRLLAEGATVFTVGPSGDLRNVVAFARRNGWPGAESNHRHPIFSSRYSRPRRS